MTRCCIALAGGVCLGVLLVGVVGAALIEFTAVMEDKFK